MSRLDATAGAYVTNNQFIRPINFIFMDFLGDQLRANDAGMNLVITGHTDADLNGTYDGVTGDFAELSPIKAGAGGSDTVSARLSGIKTLDDATLDLIGDESKWKGRVCKVWRIVWDQSGTQQGGREHYYTGYMVDVIIGGSVDNQFIEVSIEGYLVTYSPASHRSYLSQKDFDPGDLSGEATLSLANGGGNGHPGVNPGGGDFYGPGGSTNSNPMAGPNTVLQ